MRVTLSAGSSAAQPSSMPVAVAIRSPVDLLCNSVERGEWKSAQGGKRERARYSRSAKVTVRKVSSLLHKYATGRRKEVSWGRLDHPLTWRRSH
jgi:hypothetical protein